MNDITCRLAQICNQVKNKESIDDIIDELEMIKMDIEQRVSNTPNVKECEGYILQAQKAINQLENVIPFLEEIDIQNEDEAEETLELLEEIEYYE